MGTFAALSARGVARHLGVSLVTVRAAIVAGELPAARLGRRRLTILRADVDAWIRRHQIRPTDEDHAVLERVHERKRQQGAAP